MPMFKEMVWRIKILIFQKSVPMTTVVRLFIIAINILLPTELGKTPDALNVGPKGIEMECLEK